MDGSIFPLFLLIWAICGMICATIADRKGRDGVGWFVVGLFLGPLSVLFVLIASDERTPEKRAADATRRAGDTVSLPRSAPQEAPQSNGEDRSEIARPVRGLAAEIAALADLRDRGALTDDEFAAAKARLI